jgi:hypothetical protein
MRIVRTRCMFACAVLGACLSVPAITLAQGPSLASLADVLELDQAVIVVDRDGVETHGRLVSLTATSVRLSVDGRPREVDAGDVRAIFVQRRGSRRGAYIGFGIGAGLGIGLAAAMSAPAGGYLRAGAVLGGIGAGIGAAVGSAFTRREQVFDASPELLGSQTPDGHLLSSEADAQQPSDELARARPDRKWAVSFLMGPTIGGPAPGLEGAMRDAQFDESRGGCFFSLCFPGVDHPRSSTGFGAIGFPWHISVQRRLSSWYGVGASVGHAPIGSTTGQRRDSADYLEVAYSVTTAAPLFVVASVDPESAPAQNR